MKDNRNRAAWPRVGETISAVAGEAFRDLVYYSRLRAPIYFTPVTSHTVLPLQELRTKLGMEGKTLDQIAEGVQAAYTKGELPKMERVAFAYMFSADEDLGPGVGPWHPHLMLYTPYYENSMLGGNQVGGALTFVGDDAGTPVRRDRNPSVP